MTPKAQYLGTPTMAVVASHLPKPCRNPKITTQTHFSCPSLLKFITPATPKIVISDIIRNPETKAALVGVGVLLSFAGPASSMQLDEPANALSLPTWAIHVSSVLEWIIAMALVWQYGERSGYESWKGLSWGMVPLLGGALCACTWHFFYNSESLEVLVALQAALTVMGNATMCIAAYRIYKSREGSKKF